MVLPLLTMGNHSPVGLHKSTVSLALKLVMLEKEAELSRTKNELADLEEYQVTTSCLSVKGILFLLLFHCL